MLSIVTIALDGMPFITWHLEKFERLSIPWRWYIVEGASGNTADTAWCQPQEPRLSRDGTTEYLNTLKKHPNVTVIQRDLWPNKTEMMNAATSLITEPGVLVQIDSDEIHETANLEKISALFSVHSDLAMIEMPCLYFVGPDIVCQGKDCWSNQPGEWRRAFRFNPGMTWRTHEPPVLNGCNGWTMTRDESEALGLTFHHFAYAIEKQAAFKEQFYGYSGATEQWRKLQKNTHWPVELQRFFPWVDDRVMVRRI